MSSAVQSWSVSVLAWALGAALVAGFVGAPAVQASSSITQNEAPFIAGKAYGEWVDMNKAAVRKQQRISALNRLENRLDRIASESSSEDVKQLTAALRGLIQPSAVDQRNVSSYEQASTVGGRHYGDQLAVQIAGQEAEARRSNINQLQRTLANLETNADDRSLQQVAVVLRDLLERPIQTETASRVASRPAYKRSSSVGGRSYAEQLDIRQASARAQAREESLDRFQQKLAEVNNSDNESVEAIVDFLREWVDQRRVEIG